MNVELRPEPGQPDYPEETDPVYIKQRISLTTWVQRLGYLVVLLAITQIIFGILHVIIHPSVLAQGLLASGVAFLIAAIVAIHWASEATKAYKGTTELFQPRVNDRLTRGLFIEGLILVGLGLFLIANIVVQKNYSTDFVDAKSTTATTWRRWYPGRTQEGIDNFLTAAFITQLTLISLQILYFGFASRSAFRCLKWDNRTMSYLVFLGNALLLAFALGVVFFAVHALGYGNYPQIKSHFPMWNVRALIGLGIIISVVALVGFLVDHRGYRVGFLVVGFLLLFLLLLLVNFTGFAYRHTRQTYRYYKGVPNIDTCTNRMYLVNLVDLDAYGCPRKYLDEGNCTTNQLVDHWEVVDDSDVNSSDSSDTDAATVQTVTTTTPNDQGGATTTVENNQGTTTTTTDNQGTTTTTTTTSNLFYDDPYFDARNYMRNLAGANDDTSDDAPVRSKCLNTRCCGLLGQLYTSDLLRLANFGLLTILAGTLSVIGCFYFWHVSWIDSARNKKRDFLWLGIMLVTIIAFLVLLVGVHPGYVDEKTGAASRHLGMKEL